MSIFSALESDVSKWFGKEASFFKKVFEDTSKLTLEALPVVEEISNIVGTVGPGVLPPAVFTKLTSYLDLAVKDTTTVQQFTATYADAPQADVLHRLAQLVLSAVTSSLSAKVRGDLDTAVQLAFSAFERQKAIKPA
jgi:CBS-domain-containing membrane protein